MGAWICAVSRSLKSGYCPAMLYIVAIYVMRDKEKAAGTYLLKG
jgi:hypothetical protein